MILESKLIENLQRTTSTHKKVATLAAYFSENQGNSDSLWMVKLLMGKRPSRPVSTTLLREWCAEKAHIPLWLFEENYAILGDLAETITLVIPSESVTYGHHSLSYWINAIIDLKAKDIDQKKAFIISAWSQMKGAELWLFNKIITGGFRVGVSKNIIVQSLAEALDKPKNQIAQYLMGDWDQKYDTIEALFMTEYKDIDISRPYPFYLCHGITQEHIEKLSIQEYCFEWKWDGIRCQWIFRDGSTFLWSRGEEIVNQSFPEISLDHTHTLPSFVLDGELLAYKEGKPLEFSALQQRIGRKTLSAKTRQKIPVVFVAYDLLEYKGQDIRHEPFYARRSILEYLIDSLPSDIVIISPLLLIDSIHTLHLMQMQSRDYCAEGIMIKDKNSPYLSGRKSIGMYKWKVAPYTVDAVMIYAQRGHGRRANLYSDFTFAVRDGNSWISFAKAYSGLTDQEMTEITQWIKKNIIENYGPVVSVVPQLVFEIAFEGITQSKRHKSGIAVRFPRILRWRKDKLAEQCDTLAYLKKLLN